MARAKKRTGKQRKAPRKQTRKPGATPKTTALVHLDQTPFLKKAATSCRRLRTELHKKQQRLRQFEEEELAEYERWVSSNFGREKTRLRELHEERSANEFIAEQLGWCDLFRHEKLGEVYEELMRRKKEGTLHEFVPPDADDEDEESDEEEEDAESGSFEDEIRRMFESFFKGAFADDEEDEDASDGEHSKHGGFHGRFKSGWWEEEAGKGKRENPGLKMLYRAMAKRLHPDHSEMEESIREKRWHELQEAHEKGDMDAIRRIEAVCDMDETGISIQLGLARLRDLTEYHKSHLGPIRQALREAKRHPAFGFAKRDRNRLYKEMKEDLQEQIKDVESDIQHLVRIRESAIEEFLEEEEEEAPFPENPGNDDEDPLHAAGAPRKTPRKKTRKKARADPRDDRQMEFF